MRPAGATSTSGWKRRSTQTPLCARRGRAARPSIYPSHLGYWFFEAVRGSRSCRKSICDGYIPDQPERAGWIEDGPDWLAARRLCNRLVHECLRGPEEMAAVLRDAFRYIDVQRQTLQRMTQEAAPGCSHHAANPHIAQRRTPIWRIATNDKDRHRFLPFIARHSLSCSSSERPWRRILPDPPRTIATAMLLLAIEQTA